MSEITLPNGSRIKLAMWLTKILRTTAPGRLVVPGKLGQDDWMWLVHGVTVPPQADYEPAGNRPARWRSRSTDGEIVIRLDDGSTESPPCYQADTLALVDAHERVRGSETQHHLPQLAALWDHFEAVVKKACHVEELRMAGSSGAGPRTWPADMAAFAEAMKAAAGAWAEYSRAVVGTMNFHVMARDGQTLVIERRSSEGTLLRDEIPVLLNMLEKRPVL